MKFSGFGQRTGRKDSSPWAKSWIQLRNYTILYSFEWYITSWSYLHNLSRMLKCWNLRAYIVLSKKALLGSACIRMAIDVADYRHLAYNVNVSHPTPIPFDTIDESVLMSRTINEVYMSSLLQRTHVFSTLVCIIMPCSIQTFTFETFVILNFPNKPYNPQILVFGLKTSN